MADNITLIVNVSNQIIKYYFDIKWTLHIL